MQWLSPALLAIQVISALAIIVLVLLQQGKGSEMGAAFGSGSAGSLFGASGAANFLSRTTKWAAIVFFATTGGLAYIAHHPSASTAVDSGIMQGFKSAPATESTPAPTPKASGTAVPSVPEVPSSGTPAVPGSTGSGSAVPGSTGSSPTAPAQANKSAVPDSVPSIGTQGASSGAASTIPNAPSNAKAATDSVPSTGSVPSAGASDTTKQ